MTLIESGLSTSGQRHESVEIDPANVRVNGASVVIPIPVSPAPCGFESAYISEAVSTPEVATETDAEVVMSERFGWRAILRGAVARLASYWPLILRIRGSQVISRANSQIDDLAGEIAPLPTREEELDLLEKHDGLMIVRPCSPLSELRREVAEAYLDARHKFVQEMGWLKDRENDLDVYDSNPSTFYCIRNKIDEKSGAIKFAAGLRLTRAGRIEDSLSFSMLAQNLDMQWQTFANAWKDRDVRRAMLDGNLWDVTRQLGRRDGSISPREIRESIAKSFGAAIGATAPTEDTVWFFVTTKELKDMLERNGVELKVLSKGYVSLHDEPDPENGKPGRVSYVCATVPARVLASLQSADNPLHRGFGRLLKEGADLARQCPDL